MSKTKLLPIILIAFLASACSRVLTQKDIKRATDYCESRGGLFSIEIQDTDLAKDYTCKNGDVVNANDAGKSS